MHNTTKKAALAGGLALLCLSAVSAQAATVSFTQAVYNVDVGGTLTVNLVGSNFNQAPAQPPDGAAFALTWDPTVLSYVGTSIANPPWDTSFVAEGSVASGSIDYVFLNKTTGGYAGSHFDIATFTFTVIGTAGSSTLLDLSIDPWDIGFIHGLDPIEVNFMDSQVLVGQVQAVPVPAAAWLLGSGLLGLFGALRRKQA